MELHNLCQNSPFVEQGISFSRVILTEISRRRKWEIEMMKPYDKSDANTELGLRIAKACACETILAGVPSNLYP